MYHQIKYRKHMIILWMNNLMMEIVLKKTSIKELADKYDYFLFDCDGVLWQGE